MTAFFRTNGPEPRISRADVSGMRPGNITVLAAASMVFMLVIVAFAIDLGMICVAKGELQRSADAAALAAASELLHQRIVQYGSEKPIAATHPAVANAAMSFAKLNAVGRVGPNVDRNSANVPDGEFVVGELVRSNNRAPSLGFKNPTQFNSVAVNVKRSADRNGEVGLFFARVIGQQGVAVEAHAQAAFLQSFRGFRIPPGKDPATLMILPFALEKGAWQSAQSGIGPDDCGWDADREKVLGHGDGIPEIHLFPLETGAGGNFGTVDLGSNNSNTPTLRRHIVKGVTADDREFHGGEIALNAKGELTLSGDPGLKAGAIEPELRKIIGEPRIVPLYSTVSRNGNQAQFTIVGFVGGRVLDVELTTSKKYVKIQGAPMITRGGIEGKSGTSQIYSPVALVK